MKIMMFSVFSRTPHCYGILFNFFKTDGTVIIIFFFAQRYFIQGVTLTGMKG